MSETTRIGLGHCNNPVAFESGRTVALQALNQGNIARPDLVLAFCSGRTDAGEFLRGLRTQVGPDVPILGGSAVGTITNDHLAYEGSPTAVAVLEWAGLVRRIAFADGLDQDERRTGQHLGAQLVDVPDAKLLLTFYDSVRTPPTDSNPPILNASRPLISGLEASLGAGVPIVGGGLMGGFDLGRTQQFSGGSLGQQRAVGALLGGPMQPFCQIMHGCSPKDGIYHTITRMEGSIIYEIDGRSVVEMIDAIYGNLNWRAQHPVKRLALGVNLGERYGAYREEEHISRLIAGVLPQGDGIVLFEPDLEEGTEIVFMLRDGQTMIESARQNSAQLRQRITQTGRRPRFGLYIDCAGRTASYSETLTEEAAEVQSVFNEWNVPLLGFYSGVEVAPLLGRSRGLDWTGVLLVLTDA